MVEDFFSPLRHLPRGWGVLFMGPQSWEDKDWSSVLTGGVALTWDPENLHYYFIVMRRQLDGNSSEELKLSIKSSQFIVGLN